MRTDEIKNEIRKRKEKIKQKDLKYKINKYLYAFQNLKQLMEMDRTNLSENMIKFINKSKPKTKEDRDKRRNTFDNVSALYEGQELTLNASRNRVFPIKATKGERRPSLLASSPYITRVAKVLYSKVFEGMQLKILILKQILQRLPIALAQVNASNISKNLLNQTNHVFFISSKANY